jgi:hypothetical protein
MKAPTFPSGDEASEVADWVELSVMSKGTAQKRGNLTTTLEREDAKVDAADVFDEVERRHKLMGTLWPFKLDDPVDARIVEKRSKAKGKMLYSFLAALALRQNITPEGRILFEECVTELSGAFTGRAGIRIGFPRKAPVPTSLADAVDKYVKDSSELEGKMKAPPLTDGDLGMDVANWLPFKDQRGGYLHLIGQCATGADWSDKLTELNTYKWLDHIHWAVPPVRFFATPFVISVQDFRRSSLDGGLVLDRVRLMELADKQSLSGELTRRLRNYVDGLYS